MHSRSLTIKNHFTTTWNLENGEWLPVIKKSKFSIDTVSRYKFIHVAAIEVTAVWLTCHLKSSNCHKTTMCTATASSIVISSVHMSMHGGAVMTTLYKCYIQQYDQHS